jgi:hypothetical protein
MTRAAAAAALLLMLAGCGTPLSAGNPSGKPAPAGPPPPPIPDDPIVCTADVKQCPDGSYVSRDPDRGCAFRPCPGTNKH